ncbi:MAG: hypothetical protein ACYTAF_04430 [Planctomycetota bacterium]|jgi:hypothetical protein
MRRFSRSEKKAYTRSNNIESVGIRPTTQMTECALQLRWGLEAEDGTHVRAAGQALLDLVCEASGTPYTRLELKDTAFAKFAKGKSGRRQTVWKLYGVCDEKGNIELAFRTPVRRKVFAFKTFLQTLAHEFCHHFDYHALKLRASFHTRGFYSRVDSLYRPLVTTTEAD